MPRYCPILLPQILFMLTLCSSSVHIIAGAKRLLARRRGIERAGLHEASVHSARVRRIVNQDEQKQSALEDYAERAVMMQYSNCVVTF